MTSGPLQGLKVVEFAGIGPGPFCAMVLSDMGAQVVRIDRDTGAPGNQAVHVDGRGRRAISANLKDSRSISSCLAICDQADIVIEGYRPGVMERLGLGPQVMLARNPRLVYGRMTGWGQYGPYAQRAGHDINYIAITGALAGIGTQDKPVPPLNLVGDYGGGAMMLAVGLLAAVMNARSSGQGQVVDASISDGTCYLTSVFYKLRAMGRWQEERATNLLDGGAPFYDTYRCADGKFVAIGAIEPQFYALLLEKTGLLDALPQPQMDRASWPEMKAVFEHTFASKTRDEWVAIMGNADTCFAPVLDAAEAALDPHNVAREAFIEIDGVHQPAPAPRFSRTPGVVQGSLRGVASRTTLIDWGVDVCDIDYLLSQGASGKRG
ncbi:MULTISPECIES: CaiB/BaiF CoA-transferase family protein [unclassified Pseudomonas]|uniref:CaiB/BaiF CoA transferase family protein n=1 Tax=unclassified Pseudomonas TaxID=196821 RepID=UPI0008715301|nr:MULTISPECIES: CaiB/BaiF CoA-transferase family protein [unclassified Pseudomonas]SCW99094.1 alpha-methylacyl-CoA racemase [Pseudomonas sp. NFACC56-3]SFK87865.1 alpha-methylacyl-CoA racemase [Pseudomonas sp. NFACC52]